MSIYISSSQEEKDKWIEDLNEAIIAAKNRIDDKLKYASLKSSTSKFIANDKLNKINNINSNCLKYTMTYLAATRIHLFPP